MNKAFATVLKLNNLFGYLPMEVDQIVTVVVKEMKQLFPTYCCRFFLLEGVTFSFQAQWCFLSQPRKNLCQEALNSRQCPALRDGFPVIVNLSDGAHDCAYLMTEKAIQKYLCLPVKVDQKIIAVLSIASAEPGVFTLEEQEVILAIANLTGLAIQRSRLIARLQKEKQQLEEANREINQLNKTLVERYEELKRFERLLIQSEKMAAIGQLAAGLAHEINNPASIILARLECMLSELQNGLQPELSSLIKDLQVIGKHARRITTTTQSLLSFARRSTETFLPVDLNEVVEGALSLLGKQLEKGRIQLQKHLDCKLPFIYGNPNQLQQVLINLLQNARDAIIQEGTIKVSTRSSVSGWVEIEVSDTGVGIAPENLERIFDPFFTTKEVGKGTGLGLFVTRGIIENHGGRIEVNSQPGQGATFIVTLPAAGTRSGQEPSKPTVSSPH
ncbi:Adaptive-response sensory-kinase SasA [Neomoorella glycerini]|uniref:histidine kinase n=1 Tax=Neomoorella glycerini TaxID=55779 RepID=A0A6I5ZMC9_9FIRM|nr:GAF domain-containing sensor histidine kinase [Moorella glycerini]QGP91030.1 Adaptive-response sensory-kinase SasA [Moorella glycerini]